jgi:DEAD/DEAH box helicase domain-containing protein
MLRGAAKNFLDIDESELDVGLQPARVGDTVTARVFIGDALDNGAGYAVELGQPHTLEVLLRKMRSETGIRLRAADHAQNCTSSCPKCLRNYENRLGMDVVDLALGEDLTPSLWDDRAAEMVETFERAFLPHARLAHEFIGGVPVVTTTEAGGAAVVIGHPLWRHEPTHRDTRMSAAISELQSRGMRRVSTSDLFVLDRTPFKVFGQLT